MYRSSTVRTTGPRPYPIPPMASAMYIGTADDVLFALSSERAWNDPAQYVEKKRSHERTPATIDYKLDYLERQVPPHYAQAFIEVRAYHGLPPSRHFAGIQRANTMSAASSSSSSSRARTSGMGRANTSRPSTATRTQTARTSGRTTSATRRPTTTTRAEAVENGDEPPPPPYAAEDPDPESTRILQEQLAAVVSNPANGDASETTSSHRRTGSTSSGNGAAGAPGATSTSGDAPRPHDFPATPAQRAGNVSAFQPPSSNTGSQQENLSEEERRAREESELEEAMRASRQAEKERLEYEAAIQASLASAEEDAMRRTVMDTIPGSSAGAGPSSMAGPSSSAGPSTVAGPSTNGPSSAGLGRTSFGGAPANGAGSSSGFRGTSSMAQASTPQTPPAPKPNPNDELADLFGTIDFNAPTLQPSPPKHSPMAEAPRAAASPAEVPQSEASRLASQTFQSKNPFLAADEHLAAPSEAAPAMGAAPAIPARPDSPDTVSSWSTDPSPRPSLDAGSRTSMSVRGTSPAAPDKALPPVPPEEPYYNPPIGAPPGWQKPASEPVHAPPAGPPPGWQQPAPSPTHAPAAAPSRAPPQPPQSMAMPMPPSATQPMHAPPAGPPPGWQQPQAATAPGTGNAPPSPGNDDYFHILSPISERSERPTPLEERPPRPLPRPTGPPPQWAVGGGSPPQINVVRSDTMRSNSYGSNSIPSGSYNSSVPSGNYGSPGLSGGGSPAGSSLRSSPGQQGVVPQDGGPLQPSTSSGSYSGQSALPPDVPPPVPPPAARAVASSNVMNAKGENALEMLSEYDTVFLIDDSTSMAGERWEQAKRAIRGVVTQAVKYDRNGIDCYFLNSKRAGKGLRSAEDVEELFAGLEPRGATPTGLRMEAILREYMSKLERAVASNGPDDDSVPAMNLIVVTDGAFAVPVIRRVKHLAADPSLDRAALLPPAPTDDPESVIVSIAKRLDRGDFPLSQVGVQLLQIGDDAEAREALQELDDGLAAAHGVRDMVDTVPYRGEALTSDLIVKVLLGGINRRLDRRG